MVSTAAASQCGSSTQGTLSTSASSGAPTSTGIATCGTPNSKRTLASLTSTDSRRSVGTGTADAGTGNGTFSSAGGGGGSVRRLSSIPRSKRLSLLAMRGYEDLKDRAEHTGTVYDGGDLPAWCYDRAPGLDKAVFRGSQGERSRRRQQQQQQQQQPLQGRKLPAPREEKQTPPSFHAWYLRRKILARAEFASSPELEAEACAAVRAAAAYPTARLAEDEAAARAAVAAERAQQTRVLQALHACDAAAFCAPLRGGDLCRRCVRLLEETCAVAQEGGGGGGEGAGSAFALLLGVEKAVAATPFAAAAFDAAGGVGWVSAATLAAARRSDAGAAGRGLRALCALLQHAAVHAGLWRAAGGGEVVAALCACAAAFRQRAEVATLALRAALALGAPAAAAASAAPLRAWCAAEEGLPLLVDAVLRFPGSVEVAALAARVVGRVARHPFAAAPLAAADALRALLAAAQALHPAEWALRRRVNGAAAAVARQRGGRAALEQQGAPRYMLDCVLETATHLFSLVDDGGSVGAEGGGGGGGLGVCCGAASLALETLCVMVSDSSEQCCASLTHSAPLVFETLSAALAAAAASSSGGAAGDDGGGARDVLAAHAPVLRQRMSLCMSRLQHASPRATRTALAFRFHPLMYCQFAPPAEFVLTALLPHGAAADPSAAAAAEAGALVVAPASGSELPLLLPPARRELYRGVCSRTGRHLLVSCMFVEQQQPAADANAGDDAASCSAALEERLPAHDGVQEFSRELCRRCSLWHPCLLNMAAWSAQSCVPVFPGDIDLRTPHYVAYILLDADAAAGGGGSAAAGEPPPDTLADILAAEREAVRSGGGGVPAVSPHDATRRMQLQAPPSPPPPPQPSQALQQLCASVGTCGCGALRLVLRALDPEAAGVTPPSSSKQQQQQLLLREGVEDDDAGGYPPTLLTYSFLFHVARSVAEGLRYLEAAGVGGGDEVSSRRVWRCSGGGGGADGGYDDGADCQWKLQWGEEGTGGAGMTPEDDGRRQRRPTGVRGLGLLMLEVLTARGRSGRPPGVLLGGEGRGGSGRADAALPPLVLNALVAPCLGRASLTERLVEEAAPASALSAADVVDLLQDVETLCSLAARYAGDPLDLGEFAAFLAKPEGGSAAAAAAELERCPLRVLPAQQPSEMEALLVRWDIQSVEEIPFLADCLPVV